MWSLMNFEDSFCGPKNGCHNLSLGLTIKARACKVAGQEGNPEMKESVKE